MKFSLNILDWHARAPGLSEDAHWRAWARGDGTIDPDAPQAKLTALPMMLARRLKSGSRLAVECGLTLLRRHQVDALLFTSRHGELERNFCILQALATDNDVSPTDFTLSVHNSAAGNLTIISKQPLVYSSLSAGADTFQQGLYEVLCLLQGGYQRVLLVDFDGLIPGFYQPVLPETITSLAYAVALVIEAGDAYCCQPVTAVTPATMPVLPQSLQFLRYLLNDAATFQVAGERWRWQWSRT